MEQQITRTYDSWKEGDPKVDICAWTMIIKIVLKKAFRGRNS